MPKRFSSELKERALRMLAEARAGYPSELEAIRHVAGLLGVGVETLRKWQRQAEVDAGDKPGVLTMESVEVRRLKREVAELRRANEILKAASVFFAKELDRPTSR